MAVASNPSASGIDTSSQALSFTAGSNKDLTVGSLNISSAYNSGSTFILSFDLYAPSTSPGLILGFGSPDSSGTIWAYGSSFGTHLYSYTTSGTWQSYTFDVTADVASAVNSGVASTNFSIDLQSVSAAGLIYVDNLTFTAVPEPPAYAAIVGVLAVAVAGIREMRRRRLAVARLS